MDKFAQLKALAAQIGAADAVDEYEKRCAAISCRECTGVVITGGSNSGKTTILNGITGVTLRQTSSLPDEELPLRVTFEKTADRKGFDCRTVLNRHWNAESAILYELKPSDLTDGAGRQTPLLDLADVVFYVVSALAPFTRGDLEAVKALSPARVQVVLNKLNLVQTEERPKVAEYVAGFCARLGVGKPLIIHSDDWDATAAQFRSVLPTSPELALDRSRHMDALYQEAVRTVMEQAQQQLNALRTSAGEARSRQADDILENQRKRAEWKILKTEMLELGAAHCDTLRGELMARKAAVAERRLTAGKAAGFSKKWFTADLQKQMIREMDAIVEDTLPGVEAFMRSDCDEIISRAISRGLTTANASRRIDFAAFTRIDIDRDQTDPLHDAIREGSAQTVRAQKVSANITLLIGTAAACALVFLISPSALLTFVPAGIGGVIIGIDGQSRKTVEWSKALHFYTEKNLSGLGIALDEVIRNYYDHLAETMEQKADELAEAKAEEPGFGQKEQELADVIHRCRTWLQNK